MELIRDIPPIRKEDILPRHLLPQPFTQEFVKRYAYNTGLWVMEQFSWGEANTELAYEDGPEDWQFMAMHNIDHALQHGQDERGQSKVRFAVRSGHGIGKGAHAAWRILHDMSCFPHMAGRGTANTAKQITTILNKEVALWKERLSYGNAFDIDNQKIVHAQYPRTWRFDFITWNEDSPEGFAGLHGPHVLVIFDEASDIPAIIYDTVDGAFSSGSGLFLQMGNPIRPGGKFYNSFREGSNWMHMTVNSLDCRRTDKAYLMHLIEENGGIDDDYARVRVLGLPPRHAITNVFGPDEVDAAMAREPYLDENAQIILGVDPARGGLAKTAMILRQGRTVLPQIFHKRVTDSVVLGDAIVSFAEQNKADKIVIDGAGLGGAVVDVVRSRLGYGNRIKVIEYHGGSKPNNTKIYGNKRAETWLATKQWMQGASIPKILELREQLISVEQSSHKQTQRLTLESKLDMHKKGKASPDLADALCMTLGYKFPPKRPVANPNARADSKTSWMSM